MTLRGASDVGCTHCQGVGTQLVERWDARSVRIGILEVREPQLDSMVGSTRTVERWDGLPVRSRTLVVAAAELDLMAGAERTLERWVG